MTARCAAHTVRERRGVALVLVLWLLVVLGGIGAGVVTAARSSSALASNGRSNTVARYAAESGIEATVAEIEDSLASTGDSLARRDYLNALEPRSASRDSVQLGDARFAVVIIDASARLDVNAAPVANLAALFAHFTDVGRAAEIARAVRQRIERTGGRADGRSVGGSGVAGAPVAEIEQGLGPVGQHAVFPLRALEELRHVPGVDDRIVQLAAPYLTVDGDGTINQRAASDTVMAAAFGELRDAPSRLVLVSRGWLGGHPLTHEIQAVYAISNDRLVLVHWRERSL